MKKIALSMMALVIAFSSMAQNSDKKAPDHKEFRKGGGKHFKGGNLEKLNLTEDQQSQMKVLNEDFKKQLQAIKSSGGTEEQQKEKRKALMQERKSKMDAILTPEQKKQAQELRKDFKADRKDGAKFRGDRFKNMTKDLKLSSDQSAKIAALNSTLKSNVESVKGNKALSQDEKKAQMKSLMQKHRSDVSSLLTSEQKEQLKNHRKNRPNRNAVK